MCHFTASVVSRSTGRGDPEPESPLRSALEKPRTKGAARNDSGTDPLIQKDIVWVWSVVAEKLYRIWSSGALVPKLELGNVYTIAWIPIFHKGGLGIRIVSLVGDG